MTAEFLEKLDDLIIQATKERSHYYTKNVLLEAKNLLLETQAKLERYDRRWFNDTKIIADQIRMIEELRKKAGR